jgi:spermidine synthase
VKKPSAPTSPPAHPPLSNALRGYLYFTAAATGAAIMIVEILGAKMLSPYLGLSHFVWTAQIAVTLIALAAGYYVGGRLVDRSQQLHRLYWAIMVAALYLILTVLICEPVAFWCLDANLAVGSLLASAILFFVPLALLAMTGPFLVRIITSSVSGVGGNVGRLTSISTLGSLIGTILIGYFIIPLFPNSFTMYGTASGLMLVCAGYFLIYRRNVAPVLILLLTTGAGFGLKEHLDFKAHYGSFTEKFRGNSHFGRLQVVDAHDHSVRYYLNDNLIQNTYDPVLKQSASAFTYLLAELARAYVTNINDVLCIGLGVGIVPRDFASRGAHVDVVEINPAVVDVAARYFDFQPDKVQISIDDGRHALNRCTKKYDAVILDAFLGDSSPSHLLTREAFTSIRKVLRPGGALVINAFANLEAGNDYFASSISKTLQAVFPGVRLHSNGDGAIFFVATVRAMPEFAQRSDFSAIHPEARSRTQAAMNHLVDASSQIGRVLTDDYNPVEFYDAKNREELRKRLAKMTREM